MKITNLRQRIAKTIGTILIAAGIMVPGSIRAADLGTNLVVNPSFENVDTSVAGSFGSVQILDWQGAGAAGHGFAYNYAQNYDNRVGGFVPPGNDGASGEDYYFNGGSDVDGSLEGIYQDIDVSGGATGAAIAGGQATYNLSAYFSSYLTQGDFGNVSAEFFDAGGSSLGSVAVSDDDTSQWTLAGANGPVPIDTASVRIASVGTALSGNADGYVDNVSFSIVPEPSSSLLVGFGFAAVAAVRRRKRE